VYRSLDHGLAKNAFKTDPLTKVHKTLADFGDTFVILQNKRHQADYDPSARFTKSVVLQDIDISEQAVLAFQGVPEKDRRAFCAYVLFKRR
jgi:hypothetical protein